MGIKIKNLQTGEFEKFNIPALKGEKGEPGEIEPSEKVDYIGKQHSKLRDTMNANVDYIIKTAIGEFNYLDYEGQQITVTNTLEGHAKSAILKGQTMVNLLDAEILKGNKGKINVLFNVTLEDDYFVSNHGNGQFQLVDDDGKSPFEGVFEEGKTYTLIMDVTTTDKTGDGGEIYLELNTTTHTTPTLTFNNANGIIKRAFKATKRATPEIKSVFKIGFYDSAITKINRKIMLLEGDYTNVDIPYFEGMTSVKMPVLTTVGKNLVNVDRYTLSCGSDVALNGHKNTVITKNIKVKPNTTYTFSHGKSVNIPSHIRLKVMTFTDVIEDEFNVHVEVYLHKNRIKEHSVPNGGTFTTESHAKYIAITTGNFTTAGDILIEDIQIEEGSAATPFEPYKSNILTVNEEVELRGISDVQDTLDLTTGELTERISTFKPTGAWSVSREMTNTILFTVKPPIDMDLSAFITCDNLPVVSPDGGGLWDTDIEGIGRVARGDLIRIRLAKTKASTLQEFENYTQSNPITIQYQLATPVIKTVDLSDNHVYSYKDVTHYNCSSAEGSLVPTLSVKVPTDTQLTIQEQKATTQTLLIKNMDLQQSIKEVQAMNLAFNTALYNSFNSIREEVEDIKKHVSTNENLEGSF